MKLPLATLALIMLLSLTAAAHAQDAAPNAEKPLSAYRDRNRVLLVFAPTDQDPAYREQTKLWQGEKAGFDDRQLVVVPVLADAKRPVGDPPGALAKKYAIDPKTFAVILVGKDGHDAYRSAKPVPVSTVFGTIDAMPMRRAEMKRQTPSGSSPSPAARPTPAKPDLDHDE